jgi:hypothetical protein
MVCRKIEQERADQGRFVQDGAASARQYARVNSEHTQLGPAQFEEAEHLRFPFMSPLAHALCRISAIGETSPARRPSTCHFSAAYDWNWDCLTSVTISLEGVSGSLEQQIGRPHGHPSGEIEIGCRVREEFE